VAERPRTGRNRGAFEQIFEIAILVVTETAHANPFLVTNQLSLHIAVLAAVVSFDGKSPVVPQLSLGSESVRRLQQGHQQCGDESYRWKESGATTSRPDAIGSPRPERNGLVDARDGVNPIADRDVSVRSRTPRKEREAARIQLLHHDHYRTAKQAKLGLLVPVGGAVERRKTAAAARGKPRSRERQNEGSQDGVTFT
jgi:hypothetical protein